jgi:1-pyrroline-5-carboxylate dehydrogenase
MANAIFKVPKPQNEPVLPYAPGSPEKKELKAKLKEMMSQEIEIPLIIGGKEIRTGKTQKAVCPHDHKHVLATYHEAGPAEVDMAAKCAREAWKEWSEMHWEDRAAIFLKAAELLAGPYRQAANAATMLNQSKTCYQAEIDSACELIDFYRFNPYYMCQVYEAQPDSAKGIWDYAEYRPLEGFVFAVTPFNFTSIAGNLPTSPALMGNVVLWKPASTAVLSGYVIYKLLEAAGLPPGVINFLPGRGSQVGDPALDHPDYAGIHFTGSTSVFQAMWKKMGGNIPKYKSYPRIVGETGGKDFVFAHPSSDATALAAALVRGAFEFQGQKCSAASRAYIPKSLWDKTKDELLSQIKEIKMGAPTDFRNFFCSVIDKNAYNDHVGYIEHARSSADCKIIAGGKYDSSVGYFIEPTVVLTDNPKQKLMEEEIFGPVLTIHVYDDSKLEETLTLCDETSPYALTGAIFGADRKVLRHMMDKLRHAAGNFYINDKPTGAVVSQQPFGGGRASGTNDKAGSYLNLIRWTTMRTVKETFVPPSHFSYPFLREE